LIRPFYYYALVDSGFSIFSLFIPTSSGFISVIKNVYAYTPDKDESGYPVIKKYKINPAVYVK